MKRIDAVDVLRGLAVLQMIFWQIFDFFSAKNIYSDPPFLITSLGMPINGIGLGLFAFIAGTGLYLSFTRRQHSNKIVHTKYFLVKYGGFILLSLLFTTVVFGFDTFFTWNEAVQGIGLSALFAGLILLFVRSPLVTGMITLLVLFLQPSLRVWAGSAVEFTGLHLITQDLILNALFRGGFALTHLLPLTLAGVVLGLWISNRTNVGGRTIIGGLGISIIAILVHFTIEPINFYGVSWSYVLLFIGLCYLIFGIIWVTKTKSEILSVFGKGAIVAYLAHFILIYKPLNLTGLENSFSDWLSWIFTFVCLFLLYKLCQVYLSGSFWNSIKFFLKKKFIVLVGIGILIGSLFFFYAENKQDQTTTIELTEKEVGYVLHYLEDFQRLQSSLDVQDQGVPRQFYLYEKNITLSLGDMLVLSCQHKNNHPHVLNQKRTYILGEEIDNVHDCDELMESGIIPSNVLQESMLSEYFGVSSLEGMDLNSHQRTINIGFSFDIESGRYVFTDESPAVSPCENEHYGLGLEEHELVCDDPVMVAWMSPPSENQTYNEFEYPHVSGVLGYREILDYSERYGLPTTLYVVKKDILAMQQLEPSLIERTKQLIEDGLVEIGSHTRYHTELSSVPLSVASEEAKESKKFLESFFSVTVQGFRAPYLTTIQDERTHQQILHEAGYTYHSKSGEAVDHYIPHKPWNTWELGHPFIAYKSTTDFKELMDSKPYIITLDHPWNIVYQDGPIVEESPSTPDQYRANILTAYNNGGVPSLVKNIEVT